MFSNGRKTIGIFICKTADYFQRALCEGIISQAEELGFNVAFFSSFGANGNNNEFTRGERLIAQLPVYEKLDGLILALDTVDIKELKQDIIKLTKEKCDCPVVCVREGVSGFVNLLVNDKSSMEGMIRHFVEYHGFKDVCFLGGPRDIEDAESRLACFLKVMEENHLPVDDLQVAHGHFWKYDGENACKQFIDERGHVPEAILCANDYMAISVCHELIGRGIHVPEDVAVCGYDGIWETTVSAPSVSTVKVPFREMGCEAVNRISNIISGKEEKSGDKIFDVELMLHESCGCVKNEKHKILQNRKDFYAMIDRREEINNHATFMTIDLEEIGTMRELVPIIDKYIHALGGYQSFHLCLCEGVHEKSQVGMETFTERMRLFVSKKSGGGPAVVPDVFFDRAELLPREVTDGEPQRYFFLPLHFKGKCFGYTAVSFKDRTGYDQMYQNWMVNLGNAIEDIFVRCKMQTLIADLEDMYVRDVLTGLYNRRGFDKYGNTLLEKARSEGLVVYSIAMDLDGLKQINDTYGHSQGDIALRVVAESVSVAAKNGEVCARMGGDEYSIIGICKADGEKQVARFIHDFEENLKLMNQKLKKKYYINASFGTFLSMPAKEDTLEAYMNLSDHRMYRLKEEKKRGKM